MGKTIHLALGAVVAALGFSPFAHARAENCESLVGSKIAGGTVISAERLSAGHKFPLPAGVPIPSLPPLSAPVCQVKAKLSPLPDSQTNVEVWLPETWNGKLVGIGGGGFNGGLFSALLTFNPLVAEGYATAATDDGHPVSESARWAYKHPAKLVDYGYRANHLTAKFAKALVAAYYAKPAERTYFHGCSNGGREALMEAWRFPNDYDGIVVGAPAAGFTRIMTQFAWNSRAVSGLDLSTAKLKLVSDAVLAQCDALDGVKDGVLEDPRACRFDPAKLQCKAGEAGNCLSAEDVKAVRAIYQGPRTRDGKQISSGFTVGGEAEGWPAWMTGPKASQRTFATEFFPWMVYGDPTWSLDRFQAGRDFAAAKKRVGPVLDSDSPDIRPFLKHGGKMILYHGWSDAALPPGNTIAYYEGVRRTAGAAAAGQVRLFMAPGMGHCFGGSGPSQFDMVSVLDQWMGGGAAPERVVASKADNPMAAFLGLPTKTVQTRPLCAYPKHARWNGSGSTDDAADFSCVAKP